MLLGEFDTVAGEIADHEAVEGTEYALVQHRVDDPVERDVLGTLFVLDEIQGQVDEGEGHAIVAARLG